MDFSNVKTCKIYPAIGIARLGNSPTDTFIGPELPGVTIEPNGGKLFSLPTGRDSERHFSRDVSRRSVVRSPTIRIVTPVTRPTISA
jgi:L-Lysine epsilon oxidase N-terminal